MVTKLVRNTLQFDILGLWLAGREAYVTTLLADVTNSAAVLATVTVSAPTYSKM